MFDQRLLPTFAPRAATVLVEGGSFDMSTGWKMDDFYPTEVRLLEKEERLKLTWNDDHESDFSLKYVRGWCPCAVCQGHFTGEWRFIENASPALLNVEPVGNYGMRLVWGDGHDTGIYQFDYLRQICTCPQCDPEGTRKAEETRVKGAIGGFARKA